MTYAQLQALIAAYIHRTNQTANIITWIQLAESRIYNLCRAEELEYQDTITPVAAVAALPADFLDLREISYSQANHSVVLKGVSRSRLSYYRVMGQPYVYSIQGGNIEIAPDGTGTTFNILYYRKLPALSVSAPTNALLTRFPQLFLYGAMMEAGVFFRDTEMQNLSRDQFMSDMNEINMEAARTRAGYSMTMEAV